MISTDTVAYCPKRNWIISFLPDGTKTVPADVQANYGPDLIVLSYDDAAQRHEDAAKTPVSEITKERYWYALECLPPVGWSHRGGGESFKMVERITGRITNIFVNIGKRYFTFADSIGLTPDECCKRAVAYLEQHAKSPEFLRRQHYCGECSHKWHTPVTLDEHGDATDRQKPQPCVKCGNAKTYPNSAEFGEA